MIYGIITNFLRYDNDIVCVCVCVCVCVHVCVLTLSGKEKQENLFNC